MCFSLLSVLFRSRSVYTVLTVRSFRKGQIPLRYPGRRQVRSWSQTCSELEFGISSSSLAVKLLFIGEGEESPLPRPQLPRPHHLQTFYHYTTNVTQLKFKSQIPLRYPGRRQVRSCMVAGRRPAASWNLAYHLSSKQRASTS